MWLGSGGAYLLSQDCFTEDLFPQIQTRPNVSMRSTCLGMPALAQSSITESYMDHGATWLGNSLNWRTKSHLPGLLSFQCRSLPSATIRAGGGKKGGHWLQQKCLQMSLFFLPTYVKSLHWDTGYCSLSTMQLCQCVQQRADSPCHAVSLEPSRLPQPWHLWHILTSCLVTAAFLLMLTLSFAGESTNAKYSVSRLKPEVTIYYLGSCAWHVPYVSQETHEFGSTHFRWHVTQLDMGWWDSLVMGHGKTDDNLQFTPSFWSCGNQRINSRPASMAASIFTCYIILLALLSFF